MTDGQILLLIFGLLYLAECLEWLPRWYVGFSTAGGRRWRVRRPSGEFGNATAGFLWKFPLPPLGQFIATQPLPFVLTETGVLLCALHSPNPGRKAPLRETTVSWQELATLRRDGKQLVADRRILHTLHSEREAAHLFGRLAALAASPQTLRPEMARRQMRDSFRIGWASRRLDFFRRVSRPLRFLGNGLFAYLFLIMPPIVWFRGFEDTWLLLLIPLLSLMLMSSVEFFGLHRRFFPGGAAVRWVNAVLACLAPHHAIRLGDVAAHGLLTEFHPLACACLLLDLEHFRDFAGRWIRDLRFPVPEHEAAFSAEKATMRLWWVAESLDFLERCGLKESDLLVPPSHGGTSGNASYCPRCLALYELPEAVCEDCDGLPTVATVGMHS